MEKDNVVAAEENGTVEDSNEKLTFGEKIILGLLAGGIAFAGYLSGEYVFKPLGRKLFHSGEEGADQKKKAWKKGKKRSKTGVEYDEDADYTEVGDEETED